MQMTPTFHVRVNGTTLGKFHITKEAIDSAEYLAQINHKRRLNVVISVVHRKHGKETIIAERAI